MGRRDPAVRRTKAELDREELYYPAGGVHSPAGVHSLAGGVQSPAGWVHSPAGGVHSPGAACTRPECTSSPQDLLHRSGDL